jgi:hypothetical protein
MTSSVDGLSLTPRQRGYGAILVPFFIPLLVARRRALLFSTLHRSWPENHACVLRTLPARQGKPGVGHYLLQLGL